MKRVQILWFLDRLNDEIEIEYKKVICALLVTDRQNEINICFVEIKLTVVNMKIFSKN